MAPSCGYIYLAHSLNIHKALVVYAKKNSSDLTHWTLGHSVTEESGCEDALI